MMDKNKVTEVIKKNLKKILLIGICFMLIAGAAKGVSYYLSENSSDSAASSTESTLTSDEYNAQVEGQNEILSNILNEQSGSSLRISQNPIMKTDASKCDYSELMIAPVVEKQSGELVQVISWVKKFALQDSDSLKSVSKYGMDIVNLTPDFEGGVLTVNITSVAGIDSTKVSAELQKYLRDNCAKSGMDIRMAANNYEDAYNDSLITKQTSILAGRLALDDAQNKMEGQIRGNDAPPATGKAATVSKIKHIVLACFVGLVFGLFTGLMIVLFINRKQFMYNEKALGTLGFSSIGKFELGSEGDMDLFAGIVSHLCGGKAVAVTRRDAAENYFSGNAGGMIKGIGYDSPDAAVEIVKSLSDAEMIIIDEFKNDIPAKVMNLLNNKEIMGDIKTVTATFIR